MVNHSPPERKRSGSSSGARAATVAKSEPAEDEDLDFGVLLALAYSAFVDELRAALAAEGFSDLHGSFGYVARALSARELTLRELADELRITSPGALKIVDDMESRGYLARAGDPTDRRAKRLRLTPRGEAALAAARAFHRRFEAALRESAGARDVKAVREVLRSVVAERETAAGRVALRPL